VPVATLISVLGLVAAGIGILTGVPQIIRLIRNPDASGLSYTSSILGVLAAGTWLSYGILLMDPAQLVGNVPGIVCAVITAVLAAKRLHLPLRTLFLAAAGWAPVAVTAYLLGGTVALGSTATVVSLVKMVPQVRTVFGRAPLAGLAPSSFMLTQLSATLWTIYGAAMGQPSVVVCSAVTAVLASVILSRRCPPIATARALHYGRLGVPGRILVRPLVLARRAQLTLAA